MQNLELKKTNDEKKLAMQEVILCPYYAEPRTQSSSSGRSTIISSKIMVYLAIIFQNKGYDLNDINFTITAIGLT
jgi:hypothetical protein